MGKKLQLVMQGMRNLGMLPYEELDENEEQPKQIQDAQESQPKIVDVETGAVMSCL